MPNQWTKPIPPEVRFWLMVDKREPTDCWPWLGSKTGYGYGSFRTGSSKDGSRRHVMAHRFAYESLRGPIPESLQIDHLCRNRGCQNPAHMEPVTQRENILRGEGLTANEARRTHCPKGHPLSGSNLYRTKLGRRCRMCNSRRKVIPVAAGKE